MFAFITEYSQINVCIRPGRSILLIFFFLDEETNTESRSLVKLFRQRWQATKAGFKPMSFWFLTPCSFRCFVLPSRVVGLRLILHHPSNPYCAKLSSSLNYENCHDITFYLVYYYFKIYLGYLLVCDQQYQKCLRLFLFGIEKSAVSL